MPKLQVIDVFMGAKEYGSDQMEAIARQIAVKEAWPIVITVNEHAGWWMSWLFLAGEGGLGTVVGTANDQAQFNEKQRRLIEWIGQQEKTYLPEVRRP
jgi:hypothetical protein